MAQTIEIIANLALALSVVIAVIFGIAQVKAGERDRKERLTLETLRALNTREFAELIHKLRIFPVPNTMEEFQASPDEQQILFIQFGQNMESIGMMVYERYIDLALVDKTLGSYVSTMWNKYRPMILDMREKMPDPFLSEYFQWLAERVEERMQNSPREPYFKNPDQ